MKGEKLKAKLTTKLFLLIVVGVVIIVSVCLGVFHLLGGKLDNNGFNSKGIRELSTEHNQEWEDIDLGKHIFIVEFDDGGNCNVELRKPTYKEIYNYLLEKDYNMNNNLTEDEKQKLKDDIQEYLDESWRMKYFFNDVVLSYKIEDSVNNNEPIIIDIFLNRNGTIRYIKNWSQEKDICEYYGVDSSILAPYKEIIEMNESSDSIVLISGTIEKR